MQNVLLWNLILKSNRIMKYKIWENFLNIIIQLGHFPRISCHSTLLKMASFQGSWYIHTRVLEKLFWVLEKSWKFVSEKEDEPWIVSDSNLNCYVIATGMIFALFSIVQRNKQRTILSQCLCPSFSQYFQKDCSQWPNGSWWKPSRGAILEVFQIQDICNR